MRSLAILSPMRLVHTIASAPPVSARQFWFNRLLWFILAAVVAVDILAVSLLGWGVDWKNLFIILAAIASFGLLALGLHYRYREPRFTLLLQVAMQFFVLFPACALLNYVTNAHQLPLQDANLIAMDHLLGFDWQQYLHWVRQYPLLTRAFTFGYVSASAQCLVLLILLILTGRYLRLQQMIFIILTSAIVTLLLAGLLPALGGYLYYDVDETRLAGSTLPAAARLHEVALLALRAGEYNFVDFRFAGLVTFPSFHTTYGVLLIYLFWPFRLLRYPILLLNTLLILSTPVDGGHYLVDVLAGALIGLAAIFAARTLLPDLVERIKGIG